MTATGIVLGLAALLIALWLTARARRYSRVFANEHWLEIAAGMVRLKAAALARVIHREGDEPRAQDDPRILTTREGVAIVYTVSERDGRFLHHWSVSATGGPTTHALGGVFTIYVGMLLRVQLMDLHCEVAESTVHHAELSLDAAQHEALAAAPVLDVAPADLARLHREALVARDRINWRHATRC